jgi:two-component system OmpR family sensor kinase
MQCPVEVDDRIQYIIQLAAPMHDVESNVRPLRVLFLILIPVGLVLSGAAAYFISVLAFKPVLKMVRTAETISANNLDARLDLPLVKDEIYLLGRALNDMIDRLDGVIKSQKQFIADASHEIRTPLTIMRSELEYAHNRTRTPAVTKAVSLALGELDHLSVMVNDLLMLARLDGAQTKLTLTPVRLDELIIECVQAVQSIAKKKRIRLRVYIEEAIEIEGDRKRLMSVFLNILDNAIRYSKGNKEVSVTLEVRASAPKTAAVAIKDLGPGISKEEQDRVFTRFYRGVNSRSRTDGSGLGLAIAFRFVELHGGRIVLQSVEGKGSTFTVELPIRYTLKSS